MYKRQGLKTTTSSHSSIKTIVPSFLATHLRAVSPSTEAKKLVRAAMYIPVSYTHLDVYKRQVHGGAKLILGLRMLYICTPVFENTLRHGLELVRTDYTLSLIHI